MIRRIAFALAVLTATIYWANCKFTPGRAWTPEDPAWNGFFAFCFQGPVTDPSGFGEVTVILEARTEDKLMLGGCVRVSPALGSPENGTLSGTVLDDRQEAEVTVTPTLGSTYMLGVRRNPDGEVNAANVNLSNKSGAPFTSAANLQPCAMTCSSLSIRMPFLPGGGAP